MPSRDQVVRLREIVEAQGDDYDWPFSHPLTESLLWILRVAERWIGTGVLPNA
jgi:hypothetical protein